MRPDRSWLKHSEQFYAVLLHCYPVGHRRQFEAEMQQVFRAVSRDIYRTQGLGGLLVLWLKTLLDVLKTALEERLKETSHMTRDKFIRLGGWAFILAGLSWIIFVVGDNWNSGHPVARLFDRLNGSLVWYYGNALFYSLGLFALYTRFQGNLGQPGRIGLLGGAALNLAGYLCMAVLALLFPGSELAENEYVFWFLSWGVGLLGLLLFGFEALRRNFPAGWKIAPFVPVAAGIYLFAKLFLPVPDVTYLEQNLILTVAGLGIVVLGMMLQAPQRMTSTTAAPQGL